MKLIVSSDKESVINCERITLIWIDKDYEKKSGYIVYADEHYVSSHASLVGAKNEIMTISNIFSQYDTFLYQAKNTEVSND